MSPSRRTFLHMLGLATPLLANPFGWFRSLFAPDGEVRPWRRPPPNPFVQDGKAVVSLVGGADADAMVREAVRLLGGLGRLAVRGKTVLIKPNVVSGDPPPVTTSPAVVAGVVRLFRDAGAGRVIVGDMSGLVRLPTNKNLERTGIARAARDAGAEVIDFDRAEWIELKPPGAWLTRSIHVAKPVYDADLLINLPVVKTHRNAAYSICLKNLVGVTHPRYRPYRVNPDKWEEVIAEINLAAHPVLNIVDATTIMVADGPWKGPSEETNLIIASGDRIAADVVGLALLKHFDRWEPVRKLGVWEQRQITHAQFLGLGAKDKTAVNIVTSFLEGDRKEFSALIERIRKWIDE
ncbi:MAG: DUF362 domain-containing protein [Nitrospirota bacterium]